MATFHTLRWTGNALELLDQRALPGQCTYLRYQRAADVATAIRDLVVRGAPAIGCAAAYGIALEALHFAAEPRPQFDPGLDAAFATLAQSRPTAVNLAWAL
ncbi:MAG: S-methyl-5-thioribose-1-phosphate isomerase, partial [Burkholderiales bacterium]